jgi:hypothetical protein
MYNTYDHISKDGKHVYEGILTTHEFSKVMTIAEKNHLVGLSINDYIGYIIDEYYDKNFEKPLKTDKN